jgi:hypothetical protein
VMNSEYFDWITTDDQGLARSLIAQEHVFIGDSKLTLRDVHNIDLILEMLEHPTHPRSLLSLQECSAPFLEELQKRLPENIKIISDSDHLKKDQNVVLYDTRALLLKEQKSVTGVFSEQPERPFQDLLFDRLDTGEQIRILNGHLPGNPEGPARDEFAAYLARTESESIATIAMGDMNFNELEMEDALRKAYPGRAPSYAVLSPYCTNIGPYVCISKAIDHFLVRLPFSSEIKINCPEEVLSGLSEIVALLDVL